LVSIVLAFVLSCYAFDVSDQQLFKSFMKTYNKHYPTQEEFNLRFANFQKNLKIAAELDAADEYASFGVTQFSDMSKEEFGEKYLMKDFELPVFTEDDNVWTAPTISEALPKSYDWRDKDAVTPVYNQEQCGSCWAFSATEAIESQYFLAGKVHNVSSYSMEQIVQCDTSMYGCGGGNTPSAYDYIISVGGIESYNAYPYTSGNGVTGTCQFDANDIVADISNWQYVTQDLDEAVMQQFTFDKGPPSVCVDASSWYSYTGGVLTSATCGTDIDHCVQIVGWTVMNGVNAWLVRNSWGTEWGPYGGYLYVAIGQNACGIASIPTSPII